MSAQRCASRSRVAIGIDVGGTKCAGGLVSFPEGEVLIARSQATEAGRGGAVVLGDVIELARSLQREAKELNIVPMVVGLGVAELVGRGGGLLSGATLRWESLPIGKIAAEATGLPVTVDADVRAAARADARLGAGRVCTSFLYITIGTGISAALVVDGKPYEGARGLTGTFASSPSVVPSVTGELVAAVPLEQYSSGPALAARFAALRPGFDGTSEDVFLRADAGDAIATSVVASAAAALGSAIGQLVNVLDPEAIVLGGGLGLTRGRFRDAVESSMRRHIWSSVHRSLPLLSTPLGVDAGLIGAAMTAMDSLESADHDSGQRTKRL